jgi:hypothetical protein
MSARRVAVVLFVLVVALAAAPLGAPALVGTSGPRAAAQDEPGPEVFLNEIHYANSGVDAGEFIEIAGSAGTDVTGIEVVLYDGETGRVYSSSVLATSLGANGVAVVDYPVEGIQDGPDAVALVEDGAATEFLSYGGEVQATDGPAAGQTSTDIGLTETEETSPESSLQLVGVGNASADFSWTGPLPASRGAPNDGQTLTAPAADDTSVPGLLTDAEEPGDVVDTTVAPSDPANELLIEGESLVPTAEGTVTISQASTGNLVWSGDRQLRVNAVEPFDSSTVTFHVPRAGPYVMSVDMTAGANFGVAEIALDGVVIGQYDGRPLVNRNVLNRRHPLGQHELTAGAHTLTLTAIQANAAGQLRMGLDLLRLRLQPTEGRLVMTPWSGDTVAGKVPVYGWSAERDDRLRLEVDREDVSDWDAIAQTATLLFEARQLEAGSKGAPDGVTIRGKKTLLGYDISNGSNFVTHGLQVSGELLVPGDNSVTIFSGPESAAPNSLDDFAVRNVWLVLDGQVLKDPARPDGTIYLLGDNPADAARERVWTFAIPTQSETGPDYTPARAYTLDTQLVPDGRHVATLSAEAQGETVKQQNRFTVDNNAPVVSNLSPPDGAKVKGTFRLTASVTDEGDPPPAVVATLDGSPVELGATVSTDDLADGSHTFSVVATDAAGSSDSETSTFTTVGETPDAPALVAPADRATGVPRDAPLKVTARDPDGEPLQVTFLRATPAGPPVQGRSGTSTGEAPAPATGAGNPVDVQAAAASDDVYVESEPAADSPFQRYDVPVSRVRGAKTVDVSWEGRVAPDREAVLSVWDMDAGRWTEVAAGRGADGADTTLVGRTRLGPTIDDGVVHVLVEARDPFDEVASDDAGTFEDPESYAFSVAWMTDTQYLSQGGAAQPTPTPSFAETYQAMVEWVRANQAARKIVYSAHTGDIVNSWQKTSLDEQRARREYQFASTTMGVLDDNAVPNGLTPGNHDNKTGSDNDLFNEFFGPARYDAAEDLASTGEDGEGYYGGPWQPGDNHNHYDLVEAGGQELLFLYLGYLVKPEEIAWANAVLAEHRDRKAVVLTHSYLLPSNAADGRGGLHTFDDGEPLFEQVVEPNENVFLVLSGHTHGVGRNIVRDVGVKGHVVVEMVANHQFFEVPGGERRVGHLRLLQFDLFRGRVSVNTYSPFLDDHNANEFDTRPGRDYLPSADEFVVPVDLPSRTTGLSTDTVGLSLRTGTVIGTAPIASGAEAAFVWQGLSAATRYGWYARATDPQGFAAESSVFTFTTSP